MTTLAELSRTLLLATGRQPLSRMSVRELAVLTVLATSEQPWGTMELAAALRVGKPTITRATTRLTIMGLALSVRRPKDGRRRNITITEAGRLAVAALAAPPLAAAA